MAYSPKQAQAAAVRDKAKQRITVAEILAAWQRHFKPPDAPAQPLQAKAQPTSSTGDERVDPEE